jgi:hypothetical protein
MITDALLAVIRKKFFRKSQRINWKIVLSVKRQPLFDSLEPESDYSFKDPDFIAQTMELASQHLPPKMNLLPHLLLTVVAIRPRVLLKAHTFLIDANF